MNEALVSLAAASIAFVGLHFALSHPLRRPLVGTLGERGFMALYSVVALGTFIWMVRAFKAAPYEPRLWNGFADAPWTVASVLTLVALALFLGSFARNPALPGQEGTDLATRIPAGAFRVTRHPMMWGFALWALAHIIATPTARTLILAGAILVLALLGAHLQDRKKEAQLGAGWQAWEAKTSYWPRLSQLGALGWLWVVALLLWLAITWAHAPIGYVPAGIWKWVAVG